MEVDLQLNHLHMQVKYVIQDYTKCNPRSLSDPLFLLESSDETSIVIITGYKTKLIGYTISIDIAIMKI